MFVVYGTRNGGKVDQHGDQYALTRFFHIYWMPLFPVSSIWVTRDGMGHSMKMSGKSVFAGYARSWGALIAALGIPGLVPFWVALSAALGAGMSWAWKDLQLRRDKRRSDFNLLAYGTRCEPRLLPDELASSLRDEANQRWAQLSDGQSPGDVARFGTDDPDRAFAAYGVLRLTATTLPAAQRSEAEKDAERILDGMHEQRSLGEGGPYRSSVIADTLMPEKPTSR